MSEEEHQFGECALGGAVIAADDTGFEELTPRLVAFHLHAARLALCDVDDDHAAPCRLLDELDEPWLLRGVARAESLHDHGLQPGGAEHRGDDAFLDAREEGEHHDVRVEQVVRLERPRGVGTADAFRFELDVDAAMSQAGVVERLEGVELLRVDFGGAVAAHQVPFEIDAHFGHGGAAVGILCGCDFDGRDEVLLPVRAEHAHGELRAGKDDRFAQVLEHEAHGRGRVGHGVRAVEDDETVVLVIIPFHDAHQPCPMVRLHVRRVNGRVEGIGVDVAVEAFQFGHERQQVVEVEAF